MKCIPAYISPKTDSDAERKLFPIFGEVELGSGARAFHSLNLPDHRYKKMGEIDFVVLDPAGLLVCEVKGGRVRRDEDGMWEFTDRNEETARRSEGPFAQSRSAMYSLKDELKKRVEPNVLNRISFGHCVIFPDQEWTVDSVDEPRELTLDEDDCLSADVLASGLRRLLKYWAEKNKLEELAAADMKSVRNALRPSFDVAPSLRSRATDAANRLETLTREQYTGIDWVETQPRLLIAGGAGTGKTLLAAEMARRDRRHGSVLLTCQSPLLAAYLRGRPAMDGIDVLPIEEACDARAGREPWDVLLVDEAQDVFTVEGLDELDRLVAGGLDEGIWRCFYDLNNQAGLFGPIDEGMIEYLKGTGALPVPLIRNCRNSKPVVVYTQSVTGADLGQPLAGEGPRVRTCHPADRDGEVTLLSAEIARLANEGAGPGSITILSPGSRADSVVEMLPASLRKTIVDLDSEVAAAWPADRMTFATVEDFKGFENDFILLVDIASLNEPLDLVRLYIGLSRPRYGLWVAIPAHLDEEYQDMLSSHLSEVAQSLESAK